MLLNAYAQKYWNDDDNDNAYQMGNSNTKLTHEAEIIQKLQYS